jgi:SpoIID/LytB domain protein
VVELRGHGWGHGRGLGQYGSLGYAVDDGWSAAQILDHYYGGTLAGSRADGEITVRLSDFDDSDLIVTAGQSFRVVTSPTTVFQYAAGQAARIRRTGSGWVVERGPSCGGPWNEQLEANLSIATVEPGVAVNGEAGNDIAKMLIACGTNSRSYRGWLKVVGFGDGSRVVNTVLMEDYLKGVVPRESPASWADQGGGKGIEALKAQAVAARSYAWAEGRDAKFKTCDTTACQVYGGAGLNGAPIEDARTNQAIASTAGVVRMKDGAVQRTEFSSSTGGFTAGGTFPSVPDGGDDTSSNPNHTWVAQLPVATIEAAYPTIGRMENIVVLERNGLGEFGGRVKRLTIRGDKAAVTVSGDAFRGAVGLKSDWFSIASMTKPAVALTPSPTGKGYWLTSNDGGVFSYGDAVFRGSAGALALNAPVVGAAARPSGTGYWLLGGDGGIFSYGDAGFHGSTGGMRLNKPIVGMASTPSGNGYWLVASDGGIFAFGDAAFYGSTGNIKLYRPIVGMAAPPDGHGYWLVADDGGIFSYGSAPFKGAATGASQPIVGMASTPTGKGYWLLSVDGGVYNYGDAPL